MLLTATILVPCVNSIQVQDKPINATTSPNNFQTKCAFSGIGDNVDKWAKTPKIDLMDVQGPRLVINHQFEILHLGDDDFGYIKISNNGGSTWTIAKQLQGYTPGWAELEINLDQWYDEEIIIAFHYSTKSDSISDGWLISHVFVLGVTEEVYHEDFSEYDIGDSWHDWEIIHQIEIPNAPPERPSILGPSGGSPNKVFDYTFVSNDYDGHRVYYKVDWDDGEVTDWIGPLDSGTLLSLNHSWTEKGTYDIRAKAKDNNNEESKWGTFSVTIQKDKSKQYTNTIFLQLLERLLEKILLSIPIFNRLINI